MVLVGHALGDVTSKLQEPVIELAAVAKHKRVCVGEAIVVDEVLLTPANVVVQVVVTMGARASRPRPAP